MRWEWKHSRLYCSYQHLPGKTTVANVKGDKEARKCRVQVTASEIFSCPSVLVNSIYISFLQTTKDTQTTRNTFLHLHCCHIVIKIKARIANQNLSKIIRDVGCHNNCILFFFKVVYNLRTFVNVDHCTVDNVITFFHWYRESTTSWSISSLVVVFENLRCFPVGVLLEG